MNKRSEKAEPALGRKAFDFVGDIKSEFSKITWTSKQELTVYTKIVVGATFIFGMLVYVDRSRYSKKSNYTRCNISID